MKRVQKPIRLYVLTILIVVAYGLMPFVSVFFVNNREAFLVGFQNLPFNGSIYFLYDSEGNGDTVSIFISLFLCIFTAVSSIWAFYGDNWGRAATLTFITLDVLWWMGIVVSAIVSSDVDPSYKIKWASQLVGPSIWLAIIWWNFTKSDVNEYYRYQSIIAK